MAYIDGFVIPVPTATKQGFLDHAHAIDKFFIEYGALRVVECWADDVPDGKVTDFKRSVAATADESVVFSWIEWPDKPVRDAAMKAMESNEAMMAQPMPFDGKRMIYGGFLPMVDTRAEGAAVATGYIDGFVTPVTPANRDAYLALETRMAAKFLAVGAHRFAEHWGDDVPDGKVTDFKRAVQATGDEVAVFCWFEWPDKATRDAGWAKMMADPDMQPDQATMPFDGKRMIYGGFLPVYSVEK
jgi:uncharacterized protein YbaA (DUF1428 family)